MNYLTLTCTLFHLLEECPVLSVIWRGISSFVAPAKPHSWQWAASLFLALPVPEHPEVSTVLEVVLWLHLSGHGDDCSRLLVLITWFEMHRRTVGPLVFLFRMAYEWKRLKSADCSRNTSGWALHKGALEWLCQEEPQQLQKVPWSSIALLLPLSSPTLC